MDSQPMKDSELGQYVCVAHGGCLHSPKVSITSDGVWVRQQPGGPFNSAHRDCYERWAASEAATLAVKATANNYHKVTINVPLEVYSEDPGGITGMLREIAEAISEVVTDYVESALGVDIAATGQAAVTDGWNESAIPES